MIQLLYTEQYEVKLQIVVKNQSPLLRRTWRRGAKLQTQPSSTPVLWGCHWRRTLPCWGRAPGNYRERREFFLGFIRQSLLGIFIVFLKLVPLLNGSAAKAFRMSGLEALNVWAAMFFSSNRINAARSSSRCPSVRQDYGKGVGAVKSEGSGTHPTQYMSGGPSVHCSHGLRQSLGVCPLTL